MKVRRSESGRDWAELAQLDPLAAVLDPGDRDGRKNHAIDVVHKRALRKLAGPLGDKDVLDFGCGTGRLAEWLAGQGARVVGVDATPAMLDVARSRVPGALFVESDGSALPFDDATFDLVVAAYVLQYYVGDDSEAGEIPELGRVLRPGGRIVAIEQVTAAAIGRGGSVEDYARFFQRSGAALTASVPIRLGASRVLRIGVRHPRVANAPGFPTVVRAEARLGSRSQTGRGYADFVLVAERPPS